MVRAQLLSVMERLSGGFLVNVVSQFYPMESYVGRPDDEKRMTSKETSIHL
jgi:hypothetical protein